MRNLACFRAFVNGIMVAMVMGMTTTSRLATLDDLREAKMALTLADEQLRQVHPASNADLARAGAREAVKAAERAVERIRQRLSAGL